MLDPARLRRFRHAAAADAGITRFEGLFCHSSSVQIGEPDAAIVAEQPETRIRRAGPSVVFGTPSRPAVLDEIQNQEKWLPRRSLVRLERGRVVGNALILSVQGRIYAPHPLRDAAALKNLRNSNDHGAALLGPDDHPRCYFFGRAEPVMHDLHALFLHDLEPGNYGSFLFRVLPQLVLAAHMPAFDCYVVPYRDGGLRDALRALGLPPYPIFTVAEVCGDVFRSVSFTHGLDTEGVLSAPVLDRLRAVAGALAGELDLPIAGDGRLYVSRSLTGIARPWYRPLVNEQAVQELAQAAGFTPVYPETLSWPQQVALFGRARAILGPSGSGMLNAVFAPRGCKVLDLESVQVTLRQHANLYASTGKRYGFAFGQVAPGGEGADFQRPWSIDPGLIGAGLDWLMQNTTAG